MDGTAISSIIEFTTIVSGNTEKTSLILQSCVSQLVSMPKLKSLDIENHGYVHPWDNGRIDLLPLLSSLASGGQLSHLTRLGLDCIDLTTSTDTLVRALNVSHD
jgi:hypothetical protein